MVALRECPVPESMQMGDTPEKAAEYWQLHVATNPYFNPECECFVALLLNTRRRVKGHQLLTIGTMDTILVHAREVFRGAIIGAAAAVVAIAASRAKYATPRADVEAALLAEIRPDAGKTKPSVSTGEGVKPTSKPVIPPTPTAPSVVPKAPAESTGSEKNAAPLTESSPPVVTAVVSPPVTAPNAAVPNTNQAEVTGADEVSQHESLKNEIRAEAESLDFTVSPEQSIPQHGRIDLILTRGAKSIACEISVTTPPETEADHIRLRLKAGFQHVAVISANRRKLNLIQEAYSRQSGTKATSKVGFYTPKEFFAQLFTWAEDDPEDGKVEKGKPKNRVLISVCRQKTLPIAKKTNGKCWRNLSN